MIAEKFNIKGFIISFDNTASDLLQVISLQSEKELNMVPTEGSWTAGQVAEHVSRSIASISQALKAKGKRSDREAGQRVAELKAMFLDFSLKFKSAVTLLPTMEFYEKEALIAELTGQIKEFKDTAEKADLTEIIAVGPLGELTKFELLYLALYHTQRHIIQAKNIASVIKQSILVL
jgi:hypothetical protein